MSSLPTRTQLVEKVPLIKSPAFWIPKPVELPPDIHPLPEDITAYFVYPHTLEPHVLSTLPSQLHQLQSNQSQRLQYLTSLAESKEKQRKAALNKIAPGWSEGTVMQPVRKESIVVGSSSISVGVTNTNLNQLPEEDIVKGIEEAKMMELVEGLAFMESSRTSGKNNSDLEGLI